VSLFPPRVFPFIHHGDFPHFIFILPFTWLSWFDLIFQVSQGAAACRDWCDRFVQQFLVYNGQNCLRLTRRMLHPGGGGYRILTTAAAIASSPRRRVRPLSPHGGSSIFVALAESCGDSLLATVIPAMVKIDFT
jgi:hypothetical protein